MIFFGGRLSLNSIPKILIFLVALYELCIILRVVVRIILSVTKMPEGRVSDILYRITEPVLFPVRTAVKPVLGGLPVSGRHPALRGTIRCGSIQRPRQIL